MTDLRESPDQNMADVVRDLRERVTELERTVKQMTGRKKPVKRTSAAKPKSETM